jgi:hypothetical protein
MLPPRRFDLFDAAFWVLVIASLVPILAFAYFPSQDGPSHLNNANLLHLYPWGALAVFRDFYTVNALPFPNWTTHLLLAGLMFVVPVLVAEKLFLALYVVSFPLAARYCIRAFFPGARSATLLAFPFINHLLFQKGFYNFSFSVVLFFVCVGYWVRHREDLSGRRIAIFALLITLLYFSHLVSTALACGTIGLLWAWFALQRRRASPTKSNGFSAPVSVALRTLLGVSPALLLALWYLSHQGTTAVGREPIATKLAEIFTSAQAHDPRELLLWVPWELCLVVLAVLVLVRARPPATGSNGLLLVLAAIFLIYVWTPSEIGGGGGIEPRIVLYMWLTVVLWLGSQTHSAAVERAIGLAACAMTLCLVGVHYLEYSRANGQMREYLSVKPWIRPASTLLSVDLFDKRATAIVHPFKHAAGYLAAERDLVDFTNYEAGIGYFPISFQPATDPYIHLGDVELRPLMIDIPAYNRISPRPLDYVLVWGANDEAAAAGADMQALLAQLQPDYEQIYVSPDHGWARLYRRK